MTSTILGTLSLPSSLVMFRIFTCDVLVLNKALHVTIKRVVKIQRILLSENIFNYYDNSCRKHLVLLHNFRIFTPRKLK